MTVNYVKSAGMNEMYEKQWRQYVGETSQCVNILPKNISIVNPHAI